MNKVYTRINWENRPSENTAIDEINLNKMDGALNEIDTRVVEHETTKANVASLNELINYWHIDETTGVITIHKVSGEQIIFDLNIEKVPVGFSMTENGILIMTTEDGTEFTANIGSMIPILTFQDTDEIAVSVSGQGVNKTYSFSIKTGSIAEDKLQPNFLADCRLYAGNAENSATLAGEYAEQAKESAESISNNASGIAFDDTNAQLGADDVQGAIDAINNTLIKPLGNNATYEQVIFLDYNDGGATEATYTATKDCYALFRLGARAGINVIGRVNSIPVTMYQHSGATADAGVFVGNIFPVKTGDVVSVYRGLATVGMCEVRLYDTI